MSGTQPAAEAVPDNPTESIKVADSPDVKKDATDAPAEAKMAGATDNAKSARAKSYVEDVKSDESSSDRDERRNNRGYGGGYKKGYGKTVSGNKHGRDRFDKSRKPAANTNEFADLPESSDPNEIRDQVEFYFTHQNLRTDKHMFMELEGPTNRAVSIKHICTFKRMVRFQPYSAVVAALRESKDLVVVDEKEYSGPGNEGVKRKEPLSCPTKPGDEVHPPDLDELFIRHQKASTNGLKCSIYAKGFAEDGVDVGQITLENFFKPYGGIMVRKRRHEDTTKWKGSVFVEFDSEESQQQFLSLDPKPKFEGRDLLIKSKKQYSEDKCAEKGIKPAWERNEEYTSNRRHGRGRGRNDHRSRGGRGRDGRYNEGRNGGDRFGRDRRDYDRRDRSRDRGRRDRSRSPFASDSENWNSRRDDFQKKNKDMFKDKPKRKQYDDEDRKSIERDANDTPVIKESRGSSTKTKDTSTKRKADDSERVESVKKTKIEIKEDE